MANKIKGKVESRCSFCGVSSTTAYKLISGPNVFICDECVKTAFNLIYPPKKESHQIKKNETSENDSGEKNKKEIKCNFCGISQSNAYLLISGPDVYICDECIDTALGLIKERRMNPKARLVGGIFEKKVGIIREITLPQEFQQTGFLLMCYIPNIIKHKIPGVTFSTNISFKNETIYLYIKGPEQKKEEIEKVLTDFALVVQGINKPESFFDDPKQIAELKHRLKMTSVDLEQLDAICNKQGVIENALEDEAVESRTEKLHERLSWILRKEIENIDGLFD